MRKEHIHAVISGNVQGVGFRAHTAFLARQLGLTGTVENLADGTVEIHAQGTREQLDRLMKQLQEDFSLDPEKSVICRFSLPTDHFETFSIK